MEGQAAQIPDEWMRVAEALAKGTRAEDAGALIGKSRAAVHQYRYRHPEFRAMVAALREEAVQAAAAALEQYATDAVKTLARVTAFGESEAVQVRAAAAILSALVTVGESAAIRQQIVDATARLDALEARSEQPG